MSGIFVLILRILMAISLYAFLGWAIYTIWQDLRLSSRVVSVRQIPVLRLVPEDSELSPREFTIPEVVIGRDPNCELSFPDETVSGHHARLSYHHNQWWVEDLQSTNGTFLNDEKVYTPTVIISGDDLRCGKIALGISIQSK
ncbi:MAG: FHA domain-containing protein [Chloroflexi bacterium]|nr:FHA domain-containing protein [Chloroflexota bacterium]